MRFHLNHHVSIVLDEQVLPYLGQKDQEVLQIALCAHDNSSYLKELSPELKDCLLAIGGAESRALLGVDPCSCSMPFLDLRHFEEKSIDFSLRHISKLPPWTKGKRGGKGSGDRIIIESLLGPPYLQGDHKAVDPKGALDFAVSVVLRDSVWLSAALAFVSPEYRWGKQYLAERCSASIYKQVLSQTIRFGMEDNKKTYGDSGTLYKASASAPFRALKEISEQHHNNSIAIGGPNRTLLRPGMGVVIDPPLSECPKGAALEVMYGSITAVDPASKTITIRALLDRENLPEYVLADLGKNELLQTNMLLNVPFDWINGTFRVLPPQLFNGACIPQESETMMANRFLDRIVVCDIQIYPDAETRFHGFEDEVMVPLEIFAKLLRGELRLTLSRLKPFPAEAALAYLNRLNELGGGLSPPALAYICILGHTLTAFARQKSAHARHNKDPLSVRPDMPGLALMELLYRTVKPEHYRAAFRGNGDLVVEISNLDALTPVFGRSPSRFDFRGEGLGVVEFHGPFVFKWIQFDTTEPWGPLSGSVSISVGSFTEYNRMGTDVIKSSKCHPDALRGSGIKAPAVKKARTSKASSDTGRTKQASQAPAQAVQRDKRLRRRSGLSNGGSGSESTSASDVRDVDRSSSQPPYRSDSQSGGEGPTSAYSPADGSNSPSMRGCFSDKDFSMEPTGSMHELPNVVAVKEGELRVEGPAAPA